MKAMRRGHYDVRPITRAQEMAAVRALRARAFGVAAAGAQDPFDRRCLQVGVWDARTGGLVGAFRLFPLTGPVLSQSYAAGFYDLAALAGYEGLLLELGRFCIDPARQDPDILRVAWAALTAYVDAHDVQFLFGCSSFQGTETIPYLDAFALLRARHVAPGRWCPGIKAPEVFRFAARLRRKPDLRQAMQAMPPLLRTYLLMGGWVSDHAVVDHEMNTLHVFTGLEIGAIPATRKRLLRAMV